MNNTIYVISDTHFGHKRIIEPDMEGAHRQFTSIAEHDRELVARWNAVVREDDTVWHLGDVFFGGKEAHGILGQLKGRKKLVLGNHDHYPLEIYQQYFVGIYGAAEWGGCILTHVPVHPHQLGRRFSKNIHGHLHSKRVFDISGDPDPRYVCVSAEHTNLAPTPLRILCA